MPYHIDTLPEALKQKCVNALLSGDTLIHVAQMAGCSRDAVSNYKHRRLLPAVATAQKLQRLQTTASEIQGQTHLASEIVGTSPLRERLEKLWERTDNALEAVSKD